MDLRKHSGEERRRARDLFLSISYPDLYFKREEVDGDWTLFDPADAKQLTELYGDEFEKEYERLEKEFKKDPSKFNPNTKTIKAKEVIRQHIINLSELGTPFTYFKDNVNRAHKWKENGIIRSSNLCMEIGLPTTKDLSAVCNLGSINLARIDDLSELISVTQLAVRVLDNNINLTSYPSKQTEEFQRLYRAIGIGSLGEAEAIANKQIYYGSEEHKIWIEEVWKTISDTAHRTTEELALEKGPNDSNDKIRNSYLMAIAPNSSSAIFAGTTNGIEPVYNKVWAEENKRGSFVITAPHININNIEYYKNPYEIDPFKYIEVNAIRQKYVDMAISMNLFLDPEGLGIRKVRDCIVHAWKNNLKTIYYLRSKPPKQTGIKVGNISCVGCAN